MHERIRQHTPTSGAPAEPGPGLTLAGLWRAVGLGLILTVGVLSLVPSPPQPPVFLAWDKAQHALAYAVLAWWCLQCWPRQAPWLLAGLIAYGIALEGLQALTPQRMLEAGDMLANAVGAGVGAIVLKWPGLRPLPVLDRYLARLLPWTG